MAEQNIELLRRLRRAFDARDIEACIALRDPSIEFHSAFAAIGGAVYHGHDGLRSWARDMEEMWGEEIRDEPETFFDLGEQTLAFYVARGRGMRSGAEVAMPVAQVVRRRDGLMVYVKYYVDRQDALRDLGVTEDELEPIAP